AAAARTPSRTRAPARARARAPPPPRRPPPRRRDDGVRTALTAFEALLLSLAGRTDRARDLLDTVGATAAGAAVPAGGAPTRCDVLVAAARFRVLLAGGRIEEAAGLGRQVFDIHRRVPERTGLSHPAGRLSELAGALLESGSFDEARAAVLEGQAVALRDGVGSLASWFPLQLGRIALARGRCASAADHFREALAQARSFAVAAATVAPLAGLVLAAAARGRSDEETVRALRALTGPAPAAPEAGT
ncbi:hypothetical protein ACFV0G_37690, partial [Kitasatospora sp. NPDC059571]